MVSRKTALLIKFLTPITKTNNVNHHNISHSLKYSQLIQTVFSILVTFLHRYDANNQYLNSINI